MSELTRIDSSPRVPVRPVARIRRLSPRALRLALAFIEANLGERFSLDELAASAGISRFHFARLFRSTMGHSPMEYLMRLRVERSTCLLARGETSICEIAASLGFCDQSHFTRTFRRMRGTSPRDFARAFGRARRGDEGVD
jgi:transcriptional regulator GlxA family with amidase domain